MTNPIRRSIILGGMILAAALVIGVTLKLRKQGTGVGSDPAGDSGSVLVVQSSGGFAPAALAWSPDSKQIATLNMNGLVSVWDAGSGYCLQRIAVGMSSGLPREIKFSPGGTFIATRGVGAVSVVEWRGARIIKPTGLAKVSCNSRNHQEGNSNRRKMPQTRNTYAHSLT